MNTHVRSFILISVSLSFCILMPLPHGIIDLFVLSVTVAVFGHIHKYSFRGFPNTKVKLSNLQIQHVNFEYDAH